MFRYVVITSILCLSILFIGSYSSVYAVTVGPVKIEYTLDPGSQVRGELFIKNNSDETKTFYPAIEKFEENDGRKVFFRDVESTLSMWISGLEPVTLGPNEDVRTQFTMNVPENAPPGGHFGVIWWSASPPVMMIQRVNYQ